MLVWGMTLFTKIFEIKVLLILNYGPASRNFSNQVSGQRVQYRATGVREGGSLLGLHSEI